MVEPLVDWKIRGGNESTSVHRLINSSAGFCSGLNVSAISERNSTVFRGINNSEVYESYSMIYIIHGVHQEVEDMIMQCVPVLQLR